MTRHLHIVRSEPVDIHELYAENIQREEGRHFPLSRFAPSRVSPSRPIGFDRGRVVKAFCLAVAVFCIVYFPLRLLVAVVS